MTAVHARELAYVILSGGRSTRFGANKAGAKINGSGLLDRLVAAFPSRAQIIGPEVQGAQRPLSIRHLSPSLLRGLRW